ncbi:MAG: PD-(D/E)XK nuclease family protein [Nanoarchaeota archaeon]
MKNNVITVSSLHSHGYCEYKFYLENVVKVKVPRTIEMQAGSEIHEKKEEAFLKEAIPGTWDEFLKAKEYTITKEVFLKTKFEDVFIIGRVDEIAVDKNGVYIIEDKPNAKPFLSVKNQMFAYCYIFKRNFSEKTSKPIYAVLRDRDSNEEVWKQRFSYNEEFLFIDTINRVKRILNQEIDPMPTDNFNKCNSCVMNALNICPHSLAKNI